jgi:hypothetical protein
VVSGAEWPGTSSQPDAPAVDTGPHFLRSLPVLLATEYARLIEGNGRRRFSEKQQNHHIVIDNSFGPQKNQNVLTKVPAEDGLSVHL